MKQYLIDTFRFNDWANRKVLSIFPALPRQDEAIRFFSHLITSQNKWMARINNDPNESAMAWFETPYPLSELETRWEQSLGVWLKFLEQSSEDDLLKEIQYTGGDGVRYKSTIRDIALQLNYHSVHHRAQINLLIRGQNVDAPFIDYIGYSRVRNN